MKTTIAKEFIFDAAHQLPHHDGKCANLHGHTYKAIVAVSGPLVQLGEGLADEGMVLDYGKMKAMVAPLLDQLDHHFINDLMEVPTAERIAALIFKWVDTALKSQTDPLGIELASVRVHETPGTWAEVTP